MDTKKPWYLSKTLWANMIMIGALIAQAVNSSFVVSPEIQGGILAIVNVILRLITNQAIDWSVSDGIHEPPASPGGNAGFIRLRLIIGVLLTAVMITFCGCAGLTSQQVREDLKTAGQVVGVGLDVAMTLCRTGAIPPDTCAAIAAGDLTYDVIEHAVEGSGSTTK